MIPANFPMMRLLYGVASLQDGTQLDYLAGAGRRLATLAWTLEDQTGWSVGLWARAAEARLDKDDGGLMTETLLQIVYDNASISLIGNGVVVVDTGQWDELLARYAQEWTPAHKTAWHYVTQARSERKHIEELIPQEVLGMEQKIRQLVAIAYEEWMDSNTGEASGTHLLQRL